jgi:hypothetical protein
MGSNQGINPEERRDPASRQRNILYGDSMEKDASGVNGVSTARGPSPIAAPAAGAPMASSQAASPLTTSPSAGAINSGKFDGTQMIGQRSAASSAGSTSPPRGKVMAGGVGPIGTRSSASQAGPAGGKPSAVSSGLSKVNFGSQAEISAIERGSSAASNPGEAEGAKNGWGAQKNSSVTASATNSSTSGGSVWGNGISSVQASVWG